MDGAARSVGRTPMSHRRMAGGAAAYVGIDVAQRAAGFLLLPLFSRLLRPGEFGELALLASVSAVGTILLGLGLELPAFRACFTERGLAGSTVSTIVAFVRWVPPTTAALLAAGVLLLDLSPLDVEPVNLAIALVATGILTAGTVVSNAVLRAEERLAHYALVMGGCAVIALAGRVIVLTAFGGGVGAVLLVDLVAAAWAWGASFRLVRPTGPVRREELRAAISVGGPLLPHQLSHWALALVDRVLIASVLTTAAVGVYGLAYQWVNLLNGALTGLSRAAAPAYGRAIGSHMGEAQRFATAQVALTLLGVGAVAALGPPIADLVLPEAYAEVDDLIPMLVASQLFLGLYYVPMNELTITGGDTRRVWVPTATAASLSGVLTYVLVRADGLRGAALATTLGYGVLFLGVAALALRRGRRAWLQPMWANLRLGVVVGAGTVAALMVDAGDPLPTLLVRAPIFIAAATLGALTVRADLRGSLTMAAPAPPGHDPRPSG